MNRSITTADHPQCLNLEGFGRFDRRDRRGRVGRFDRPDRLGKAAEAPGFGRFLPTFCPKSMHVKKFFFMRGGGKNRILGAWKGENGV